MNSMDEWLAEYGLYWQEIKIYKEKEVRKNLQNHIETYNSKLKKNWVWQELVFKSGFLKIEDPLKFQKKFSLEESFSLMFESETFKGCSLVKEWLGHKILFEVISVKASREISQFSEDKLDGVLKGYKLKKIFEPNMSKRVHIADEVLEEIVRLRGEINEKMDDFKKELETELFKRIQIENKRRENNDESILFEEVFGRNI